MKTTRLLGIIIIGVLILLVFSFVPAPQTVQNQGAQALTGFQQGGTDRIADFIGKEGSYKCDTVYEDEDVKTVGSVYVMNNRFAASFESTVKKFDKTMDTHSVWDGTTVWSWSSLSPVGTKAAAVTEDFTAPPQGTEADEIGYTCTEASINETVFVIPSNINFEQV